jgi:hypothetical protein
MSTDGDRAPVVPSTVAAGNRLRSRNQALAPLPFDRALRAPEHVLQRELAGESVILDLETETYYGLDAVGTRMWSLVTGAHDVETAYRILADEYDVAPETLRRDLERLLDDLVERGLLVIAD